jgi:hypothetical protein
MRGGWYGLELGVPAIIVAVVGFIFILRLDLSVFVFALSMGPLMFLVDLVDGKRSSTKEAIRELLAALGFLCVGLLLAYFTGYSFVDFTNKNWYFVSRLVTFPGLILTTYGLLHLLVSLIRGQYYEENTDA